MQNQFDKVAMLRNLMTITHTTSTDELKKMGFSLSKYSQSNFNSLPYKRVNGKIKVKR